MGVSKLNRKLSAFLESGIFRFEDSNSVFIDPVGVLNQLYTRFMVSPSSYYSRLFESSDETHQQFSNSRKRKRKEKKPYTLNERERAADWRHQEAKPLLLKASESLQIATDLLGVKLLFNFIRKTSEMKLERRTIAASISLWLTTTGEWKCPPEVEISQTERDILALWVTDREELRCFVEEELFPARGVKYESRWFIDKIIGPFSSESMQMHYFWDNVMGGELVIQHRCCRRFSDSF